MKIDPKKISPEVKAILEGDAAERIDFYSDLRLTDGDSGEPPNHGSTLEAFIDSAAKLADEYEPTEIIVKTRKG